MARRAFIASSPDVVEKTLRGLVKANISSATKAIKPAVVRSIRKWLRLRPTDNADDLYERMRLLYDRRIAPTREGMQNALRVLGKSRPEVHQA